LSQEEFEKLKAMIEDDEGNVISFFDTIGNLITKTITKSHVILASFLDSEALWKYLPMDKVVDIIDDDVRKQLGNYTRAIQDYIREKELSYKETEEFLKRGLFNIAIPYEVPRNKPF
jgi:flagellar capping protein FliD